MNRKNRFVSLWVGVVLVALGAAPVASQEVLVDFGQSWKFFRGTVAPSTPIAGWRQEAFNDASWETGAMPIGYEAEPLGYQVAIATSLDDMRQIADDPATPGDESQPGYLSFYARRQFSVSAAQLAAITDAGNPDANLILSANWDDGFIGYLNGTEIARSQAGAAGSALAFDAPSAGSHEADGTEYFDVTASASLLRAGTNYLAVEVHNTNATSTDCSIDLRLSGNDPRLDCPRTLTCAVSPGLVNLAWVNSATAVYDSITVTRNGTPISGSPFSGDTQAAVDDLPGSFFNEYRVVASVGGVPCAPLFCATEECPAGIACSSTPAGVTVTWTSSANVAYDAVEVTRNGTPIAGSPFPGDTQSVLDVNPGNFLNTYEVTAIIGGEACAEPLVCQSDNEFVIVDAGEEWRFFRGKEAPSVPATAWRERTFNDATWEIGATGIGYGDADDATILDDMQQMADDPATPEDETQPGYLTVYLRKSFNVVASATVDNMVLELDYDDGFIAYLNGVEVARSTNMGAPGTELAFDDPATALHEAGTAVTFDLTSAVGELRAGTNVLAVEVHNDSVASSDLSILPRLTANACFTGGGLSCVYDEAADDVILSFDPIQANRFEVTRNGVPLPGSPFPGDTVEVVDANPGGRDNVYEIVSVVGERECPPVTCTVSCETRDPTLLSCTLRLVGDGGGGFVTQAELSWDTPAGTTSIDVEREGTLIQTLPASATSYIDPDVEADEPENDTEYDVIFLFADGTICTIGCAPIPMCPQHLSCEAIDQGGVQRARLTWDTILKEWESLNIERDADGVVALLAGTETSFVDTSLVLVPGEIHTYTLVPVAPAGEGAPGETGEINCSASCTVSGQVPELAGYDPPPGGWDYIIDFERGTEDRYVATPQLSGNLDGEWIRAVVDSWDGSGPLEAGAAPDGAAPGGIEVITSSGGAVGGGNAGVLRILDPGNPSAPGVTLATEFPVAYDVPNNRSLFLGFDIGIGDRNLLRDGLTFSARWRIRPATESPAYLGASVTGDGAPLDGDSLGQVGVYFVDDGSLGTQGAPAALGFSLNSGDILQMSTNPLSTLNEHDIDRWRSIWVTVEDPQADGTYNVTLYLNGQTSAATFFGTGTGLVLADPDLTDANDQPFFGSGVGNFLAIGSPNAGADADIEIDYLAYRVGVFRPGGGVGVAFRRGDTNDDGTVNITDGIFLLNYLFLGGQNPTCTESTDANNDGGINITDGIFILNYLFLGGADLPEPGPFCGSDPDAPGSAGDLGCDAYTNC